MPDYSERIRTFRGLPAVLDSETVSGLLTAAVDWGEIFGMSFSMSFWPAAFWTTALGGSLSWLITAFFLRWRHADARCAPAQIGLCMIAGLAAALMLPAPVLALRGAFDPGAATGMAAVLTVFCLWAACRCARLWEESGRLRRTPLSRLRSAPQGFLKARGAARAYGDPIRTKTGRIPCLYYSERTERYERHKEKYQDPKTKRERTRIVHRWVYADRASGACAFCLDDGTGDALVQPEGAEFHPAQSARFYNGRRAQWFTGAARVGDRRTVVHFLRPQALVIVWGEYASGEIRRDPFHRCLLVVEGAEGRVFLGRAGSGLMAGLAGLLAACSVVWLIFC